jgi:hypothetical protein
VNFRIIFSNDFLISTQIFRHVTVANSVVPMLSAYQRISIAMDITTALTKVTKRIARRSLVQTTNFSARMVDPTERQSASQSLNCAMVNATAKMELTKNRLARRHRARLLDVSTSADRR